MWPFAMKLQSQDPPGQRQQWQHLGVRRSLQGWERTYRVSLLVLKSQYLFVVNCGFFGHFCHLFPFIYGP
jgi:hypothetical protein